MKLLKKPVAVENGGSTSDAPRSAEVKASFDPSSGDLDINYVI